MYDPTQWPPVNNPANLKIDKTRFLENPMNSPENAKRIAELNLLRKKEMTSDAAKLVALARELKVETSRSNTAFVADEVQKAEEIARLARGVREKMVTVVAN